MPCMMPQGRDHCTMGLGVPMPGVIFVGRTLPRNSRLRHACNNNVGLHVRVRLESGANCLPRARGGGGGARPIGLRLCQLCALTPYTGRFPGACEIVPGDTVGSLPPCVK